MDTPCLILADGGRVLGRYPSHSAATRAAHLTYPHTFGWVITLDGVTLRHRHGYRSTAPAPVWPTVMPPACPVPAALQQPRTLDDLRDALPGWRRTDLFRRLLALWDGGEAVVRYEDGVAVWSCAEVTP